MYAPARVGPMLSSDTETTAGTPGVTNPPARRRRRWRNVVVVCAAVMLLVAGGFVWFVSTLPTQETAPAAKADGIVVLTGAAFRINDALDLLASGRGRRLLITGVYPTTRSVEICRLMPEH